MGDNVILGIDMNDDVRTSPLSYSLRQSGMKEAILSFHSSHSPPATQHRNNSRVPIDAIWISEGVQINRAGYAPFADDGPSAPSDHRMLWIEVENISIFGKDLPAKKSH